VELEDIQLRLMGIPPPKPRSYAFCSDTKYNESIVSIIENVDLLYHEATFLENKRARAIKTYHSTAIDAANIAKLSNAKKLLLGHYSARYNDLTDFENEAKTIFNNVVAVRDGDTFEIE
jgi:ribonuclease Z